MTPDTFRKSMITNPPFDGDDPPTDPPPVTFTPEQQELIDAQIATATEGLRNTNKALKDEKTSAKSEFDTLLNSLGGQDGVDALTSMRDRLQTDDMGKLLAEGKHDEWLSAKIGPMKAEHASQLSALQMEKEKSDLRADGAVSSLQDKVLEVDVSLAAVSAQTENTPGILRDITRAARSEFSWSDEYKQLVREESGVIVFGRDGKTPQTIADWLSTQKEESRHWWGPSVSGKARGSKNTLADGGVNPWSKEGWNLTAQGTYFKEHGAKSASDLASSVGSTVGATHAPAS